MIELKGYQIYCTTEDGGLEGHQTPVFVSNFGAYYVPGKSSMVPVAQFYGDKFFGVYQSYPAAWNAYYKVRPTKLTPVK